MSENYVVENLIGGNDFFEIPEYLLLKHPQLIEYCNTSFITEKGKAKILAKHPDLAKYFNDKNGK